MEDSRIVELYWARDERAIAESDVKYGRLLHGAQCRRQDRRISARFFPKLQDGSPLTASGMTTQESAAGCSS